MARVFISHSSRDAKPAAQLLEWLQAHGFDRTFLDFDKHAGLAPGADWERTLYREITDADAVILILTANWFDSKWCFAEFTQARALGKAIFPLIESPVSERYIARDLQTLDLIKDREGGLERLGLALTRIALDSRGGFPWDGSRPPFPGLLAFEEADAAIFFGRDDDIRRVVERLTARRVQGGPKLVALLGASGSGKSSLLRAGVLPRLKRDPQNWIVLPPFRPQIHPLDEFAQSITTALGPGANWRQYRKALSAENPGQMLSELARDFRAKQGTNEAYVLISIDQAEELFSTAEKAEAEPFMGVLNAVLAESLPFIVLMGLRSDYLGQLQQVQGLKAWFEECSLKRMPLGRVREIIEGPARVAGLTVDKALVASAVNDAATEDVLPLLAFALRELYDRFAASGRLTFEAYRALGDDKAGLSPLENAVRRRADEVLVDANPSTEDLQALRDAFVPAMVRVDAEGEYARRRAGLDALSARARSLIERLAKARLLIIAQDGATAFVEVAHEALLRKWPLLRGWLDEEREFISGKEQLEQALNDWKKVDVDSKSASYLHGLQLSRAKTWLINHPKGLSEPERQFIEASINHETRTVRKASRQKVVALTSLAVLVVSATLGGPWAFSAFNKQRLIDREAARTDIRGDILAYATVEGGVAWDTAPGRETSPYTTALLEKLHQKSKSLIEVIQDAHDEALELTSGRQRPFLATSMNAPVYLWQQPRTRAKRAVVVSVDNVGRPFHRLIAPKHDADAVAGLLQEVGFTDEEITRLHNVKKADIEEAANRACQDLKENGLAPMTTSVPSNTLVIFYFSGHGFQVEGQNFLMPTIGDSPFKTKEDAQLTGVRLNTLRQLISACSAASVFVLDTHFPAIYPNFLR